MKLGIQNIINSINNESVRIRSISENLCSNLFLKGFLFVFLILFAGVTFSQNYNWITPNQTYLKMYVANDGMYRIDKNDFVNAGITVTTIDPRTVKVYYKR